MPTNDDFLKRLFATFRIEADEHLAAISSGLIDLEKTPAGELWAETVERIYREAHSLKGAARAVNLVEIESLCHSLEGVFAALKGKRLLASPPLFDLLQQVLDALGAMLTADAKTSPHKPQLAALMRRLDALAKGEQTETPGIPPARETSDQAAMASPDPVATTSPGFGTIRVATAKLDAVMRQAEELFAPRLAAGQRAIELRETAAALAVWKKERAKVQPALRSLDHSLPQQGKKGQRELTKLLEYLEAENLTLKTFEDRLAHLQRSAEHDHRGLSGTVENLLYDVKQMHLLPFSSLLDGFPRLTRELARDHGKEVDLVISGGEIEIDRRILEEMKDPLNHLLRNSIDHGIEKPAERGQLAKPPHGTLTIAVSQKDSGKVEILIADDGKGIDVAKVRVAAARLGLVASEELGQLGERELLPLIFRSGMSTSPLVTDLSGRGLGLAIVQEKVERLSGTIAIETQPNAGTSFRIVLPLTLATFRGILVHAGDQMFIIPAVSVERVARVTDLDIRTLENRETIPLDGQTVALVWLSDMLEMPRKASAAAAEKVQVVVLGLGLARIAFRVDAILGEQEVLVKGLGLQLARVRNLAGASVLGTGQVVPVLNVFDLMKSAVKSASGQTARPAGKPAESEKGAKTAKQSILVVEDSITARALLKNILESAGYRVSTAVDGVDAYTALKTGVFDLIVSDVEMPRMDGFDLTAKVRADKQLSNLPIVLVTALASREHRERGIDVGANAYIVKSSFDQSNLLEVIGRLI